MCRGEIKRDREWEDILVCWVKVSERKRTGGWEREREERRGEERMFEAFGVGGRRVRGWFCHFFGGFAPFKPASSTG